VSRNYGEMTLVRVIDSSLIIEANRVRLLSRLSIYFQKHPNQVTIAPRKVKEETVDRPAGIAGLSRSARRIDTELFRKGLIVVKDPSYRDNKTCKIIDRIGDCIAKRSGKRRDLVERTDLDFVTLALNHIANGDVIEVVFRDDALLGCIKSVLTAFGLINKLKIISVSDFLDGV
jgi:hypothetical protein